MVHNGASRQLILLLLLVGAFLSSEAFLRCNTKLLRHHGACMQRRAHIDDNINNNINNKKNNQKMSSSSPPKSINNKRKRRRVPEGSTRWRIFGVELHPNDVPFRNVTHVNAAVTRALEKRLRSNTFRNVKVVRRSLDARKEPCFVYVLDATVNGKLRGVKPAQGRLERLPDDNDKTKYTTSKSVVGAKRKTIVVIGAGPAGLFCALQLAQYGYRPVVLERGQPVESRGRDIGALMHRKLLNADSNFCFGEGGAGTWSDGKLTTRIGRNSEAVRTVLETFVRYGAPTNILVEGAPHLGTDNLVRLLRNMRIDLQEKGGEILFGAHVTKVLIENGVATGAAYKFVPGRGENESQPTITNVVKGEAVVLATGHSARDVYEHLHASGVRLEPKGFAVGFRIEHPQSIINKIQYGEDWGPQVVTGKKNTDMANADFFASQPSDDKGSLPVPSYRLATDRAFDGTDYRGVYSFCMCPGGQIVPASTDPNELCVNGMSFSKRDSLWANSALVVTVAANDTILEPYREKHGALAGVAFQKDMENRAAIMGGGNFVVPVQRVTDFIDRTLSDYAPSSSYRLGVIPSPCHEIYPPPLVESLSSALTNEFERKMPGFLCKDALLHAVETRTSSPVRVARSRESFEAPGVSKLFPAGEGAACFRSFELIGANGRLGSLFKRLKGCVSLHRGEKPKGQGSPVVVTTPSSAWPCIENKFKHASADLIWIGNGELAESFRNVVVPHFGVLTVGGPVVTSKLSPPTYVYGRHSEWVSDILHDYAIQVERVETFEEIQKFAMRKLLWASCMWLLCHAHDPPLTVLGVHNDIDSSKMLVRLVEELWLPESGTDEADEVSQTVAYMRAYSSSMPEAILSRSLALDEIKDRNGRFFRTSGQAVHHELLRGVGALELLERGTE